MTRQSFKYHIRRRQLTGDVFSTVGDVHVVEAGGEGNVLHAAAAIFVVFARHLRLGRPLNSDAKTTNTGPSGGKGSSDQDHDHEHWNAEMFRHPWFYLYISVTTAPGDDLEVVGLISQGLLEPRAGSHHPAGVASLSHRNPKWALWNRCVII